MGIATHITAIDSNIITINRDCSCIALFIGITANPATIQYI